MAIKTKAQLEEELKRIRDDSFEKSGEIANITHKNRELEEKNGELKRQIAIITAEKNEYYRQMTDLRTKNDHLNDLNKSYLNHIGSIDGLISFFKNAK